MQVKLLKIILRRNQTGGGSEKTMMLALVPEKDFRG
jgi:hypothetical protein